VDFCPAICTGVAAGRGLRHSANDRRAKRLVVAESAFLKLANLYEELLPIFARYGFKPQSAGVVSRDVSEKIKEQSRMFWRRLSRFGTNVKKSRLPVESCLDKGTNVRPSYCTTVKETPNRVPLISGRKRALATNLSKA